MEISNFKLVEIIGDSPVTWKFKAVIDVTIKKGLFRKKVTETKEIFRSYAGRWYFVESGEYSLSNDVANLERKFIAENNGKNIEDCLSK